MKRGSTNRGARSGKRAVPKTRNSHRRRPSANDVVVHKSAAVGKTSELIVNSLPVMTLRQFAQLVDRAPSTVSTWCEAGMPHEVPRKANAGFLIRLEKALSWVLTYALEPPKESQRERLAREQADKIALENARRRGELIEAVAVEAVLRAIPAAVRGQQDAMDNRCASEFAGITDPARMRERLREEHRGIDLSMGNLTRELAETCERAARDAAGVDAAAAANGRSVGGCEADPPEGIGGAGPIPQ